MLWSSLLLKTHCCIISLLVILNLTRSHEIISGGDRSPRYGGDCMLTEVKFAACLANLAAPKKVIFFVLRKFFHGPMTQCHNLHNGQALQYSAPPSRACPYQ